MLCFEHRATKGLKKFFGRVLNGSVSMVQGKEVREVSGWVECLIMTFLRRSNSRHEPHSHQLGLLHLLPVVGSGPLHPSLQRSQGHLGPQEGGILAAVAVGWGVLRDHQMEDQKEEDGPAALKEEGQRLGKTPDREPCLACCPETLWSNHIYLFGGAAYWRKLLALPIFFLSTLVSDLAFWRKWVLFQ